MSKQTHIEGKPAGRLARWWERKRQRAVALLDRPEALEATVVKAESRALSATTTGEATAPSLRRTRESRTAGKLRQAWSDLQVLTRLTRAFVRGDYRDVSRGTLGLIVGALVYFVSPIDAILDHLPLAGYLDDAAILAWVVSEVRGEIESFRLWESEAPARVLPASGLAASESASAEPISE